MYFILIYYIKKKKKSSFCAVKVMREIEAEKWLMELKLDREVDKGEETSLSLQRNNDKASKLNNADNSGHVTKKTMT